MLEKNVIILKVSLRKTSDLMLLIISSSDTWGWGDPGTPLHRAQLEAFSNLTGKLFILFPLWKIMLLLAAYQIHFILAFFFWQTPERNHGRLAAPCCHFMAYIAPNNLIISRSRVYGMTIKLQKKCYIEKQKQMREKYSCLPVTGLCL